MPITIRHACTLVALPCALAMTPAARAQDATSRSRVEVLATIRTLFDGMRKTDREREREQNRSAISYDAVLPAKLQHDRELIRSQIQR